MKPPKIRWGKVRSGLYRCYIGDEKIYNYLFLEVKGGVGNLYEHHEYNLIWIPPPLSLKQAKNYIKLHIFYKWMEGNQHIWTKADK